MRYTATSVDLIRRDRLPEEEVIQKRLDAAARQDLVQVIEDYGNELVPLIVAVTLIRHYVSCPGIEYLEGQVYLESHPKELLLRNRV